jgi:hypothetical protein
MRMLELRKLRLGEKKDSGKDGRTNQRRRVPAVVRALEWVLVGR